MYTLPPLRACHTAFSPSPLWSLSLALGLRELPNLSLVLHLSHISLVLPSYTSVLYLTFISLCLFFLNPHFCFPSLFVCFPFYLYLFFLIKRKMPVAILAVLADYFSVEFVFRCKAILNSDVTCKARCIQDEVTVASLSYSTFLGDGVVPPIT